MLAEHQAWADRLARSLTEWLKKNGYAHMGGKKEFAEEHGIDPTVFGRITRGQTISDTTAYYAKIYLVTGLSESNPQHVPPKRKMTRGIENFTPKAWTHTQYQAWVVSQAVSQDVLNQKVAAAHDKLDAAIDKIDRPPVRAAVSSPSIGALVDQLFVRATQMLADAVVGRMQAGTDELGTLLLQLTAQLQVIYSGDIEDRDRLAREHGRKLADLLQLLDPLTLNASAREEAIRIATMTDRSL